MNISSLLKNIWKICIPLKGRQCVDPEKKIDISKYKKFLGMGKGIVDFEGEATHDTVG